MGDPNILFAVTSATAHKQSRLDLQRPLWPPPYTGGFAMDPQDSNSSPPAIRYGEVFHELIACVLAAAIFVTVAIVLVRHFFPLDGR